MVLWFFDAVLLFQLLASAAMGRINTAAKPYGDYVVAAMGAVTRIMTVVIYVVFGFLKGFQPFVGYSYGAGKFDRLKKSIKLCKTWSCREDCKIIPQKNKPKIEVTMEMNSQSNDPY